MSPGERKRIAAECHAAAHEVFAAINRSVGSELLSLDLPMGQFKAMAAITIDGPQPVGELGRRLGISEPAASLLVGKLEERGLAARVRDEQDRRRTLVTATAAGEELATRLRQGKHELIEQWMAALTDEEINGLLLGFRGLRRVAGETQPAGDGAASAAGPATAAASTGPAAAAAAQHPGDALSRPAKKAVTHG